MVGIPVPNGHLSRDTYQCSQIDYGFHDHHGSDGSI